MRIPKQRNDSLPVPQPHRLCAVPRTRAAPGRLRLRAAECAAEALGSRSARNEPGVLCMVCHLRTRGECDRSRGREVSWSREREVREVAGG